ncbi:elongation factor 4, partial [Patescibacteria group bacterium]|nr:elongation factor 4 [Patescibacteria group bacterium]
YRGVVASVRIVDGSLEGRKQIRLMASNKKSEASEVGTFTPELKASKELAAGKIGYVVTGLKDINDVRVGDTITLDGDPATETLPGYADVQPMVFAGLYAENGAEFEKLRDALGKLALNDASLIYEPTSSASLGMGFRCGFLGLLHLDIVRERLKREHNLELVITSPTVSYELEQTDGKSERLADPSALPDPTRIKEIREPWAAVEIVCRNQDIGPVQQLISERRGVFTGTKHLGTDRVMITAEVPLAALVVDFYDALKGATSGYGSLSYKLIGFRAGDLVKLDILVAGDQVESLSMIVHRSESVSRGQAVLSKLKDIIPKEQFKIALQAAIGGKIVGREDISAMGKNVTAGLYGGDVTRKRKQLEKQKKGKAKLKSQGRVKIPPEAFTAVLGR